jgi:hypothetical protein
LAGLLLAFGAHDVVQIDSSPVKKLGVAGLVWPIMPNVMVLPVATLVVVAKPVVPPVGPLGITLVAP